MRASGSAGSSGRASTLAVWSWVLYDFSNTIFSVSILAVFFPLWVEGEIGEDGTAAGYVGRFSAVLGPALTAMLLLTFGRGRPAYRISVGSLALIMALGIFFLIRVPDVRPDTTVDEYAPLVQGERTV